MLGYLFTQEADVRITELKKKKIASIQGADALVGERHLALQAEAGYTVSTNPVLVQSHPFLCLSIPIKNNDLESLSVGMRVLQQGN